MSRAASSVRSLYSGTGLASPFTLSAFDLQDAVDNPVDWKTVSSAMAYLRDGDEAGYKKTMSQIHAFGNLQQRIYAVDESIRTYFHKVYWATRRSYPAETRGGIPDEAEYTTLGPILCNMLRPIVQNDRVCAMVLHQFFKHAMYVIGDDPDESFTDTYHKTMCDFVDLVLPVFPKLPDFDAMMEEMKKWTKKKYPFDVIDPTRSIDRQYLITLYIKIAKLEGKERLIAGIRAVWNKHAHGTVYQHLMGHTNIPQVLADLTASMISGRELTTPAYQAAAVAATATAEEEKMKD